MTARRNLISWRYLLEKDFYEKGGKLCPTVRTFRPTTYCPTISLSGKFFETLYWFRTEDYRTECSGPSPDNRPQVLLAETRGRNSCWFSSEKSSLKCPILDLSNHAYNFQVNLNWSDGIIFWRRTTSCRRHTITSEKPPLGFLLGSLTCAIQQEILLCWFGDFLRRHISPFLF